MSIARALVCSEIDNAILSTIRIEPGKLSLGESQNGPVTKELEIKNNSNATVTYDLSYESGPTTYGVIVPDFWGMPIPQWLQQAKHHR